MTTRPDSRHHARITTISTLPPSGEGTVVLDIGDGGRRARRAHSGAFAGVEIEIARRGETQPFVHTEVRERHLPDGLVYAGVFAALPEGDYTLLDAPPGTRGDVEIRSGCVTEVDWSLG